MKPLFLIPFLLVAACTSQSESEPPAEEAEEPAPPSQLVEREEVAKPAPPPAPPAQAVIQTQPGPAGSQVALNRVAVTGDVMTVQLTYTGPQNIHYMKLDQVSVIDDATAQQISILKNNAGAWLASPLSSGNDVRVNLYKSPAIVWFKFPAPPPTSQTVSINIPDVGPFDGVPVTR